MADPYQDPNSAMGGYLNGPQPFMGAPVPNYNPMGSRNPDINMAFAQYAPHLLPQFFGGGRFLPQQFPAQSVLDQMVSSKYNTASRANENAAREIDQGTIYKNLVGLRGQFDRSELSELGAKQLKNTAGVVNSQFAQDMAGMLLGPQVAEDIFYGRKGSAVRLAREVNKVGFYRPDSVDGDDKMSEDSLQEFSNQIYSNLYRDGADLNDVSGFSAGRVGTIMSELQQRGMLPASMSKLTKAEQRKAMQQITSENDLGLSDDVKGKIDAGASVDELAETAEGMTAVRKIDATRVSNSLKDYTKALASVRQIFGDNGISNAPMQQLMAAMDAISQNSGSTLSAGKIENLMRRTQMASRDSGVSLEALMGLEARSGAIADQYGLSREIAAENVITAMNTGQALRNTGGFNPGFGRMDSTKATMFALDQTARTDASAAGKYSGAIARIVAENEGRADFKGTRMRKFISALESGESTFFDEDEGRVINIHEELGRNPDEFMRGMLDQAGISVGHFSALVNDKNTQEYQRSVAGSLRGAQAYEIKEAMAVNTALNSGVTAKISDSIAPEQKRELALSLGRGLSGALVDEVNTATMSAPERLDVLKNAMNASVVEFVQKTNPTMDAAAVRAKAAEMTKLGDDNVFGLKNEQELQNFLSQRYAEAGAFTQAKFNTSLPAIQQTLNARVRAEEQRVRRTSIVRAGLDSNLGLSDGSNFLQRVSDALGGDKPEPLLEQMFGVIDSTKDRQKLEEGIAGGKTALEKSFGDVQNFYRASVMDTKLEKEGMLKALQEGDAGAATVETFKKQFEGTAGAAELADKKKYMSTSSAAGAISAAVTKDAGLPRELAEAYRREIDDKTSSADLEKIFANPGSKEAQDKIQKLAASAGAIDQIGERVGIGKDVLTESQAQRVTNRYDAFAIGVDDKARKRVAAGQKLFRELDDGAVSSTTILGALGAGDDALKSDKLKDVIGQYIENKGGSESELRKELTTANVTGEMADKVVTMSQFSRNLHSVSYGTGFRGLGMQSAQTRAEIASRETALQQAVESGQVKGSLGKAVNTVKEADAVINDKNATPEDREKAQKARETAQKEINAAVVDDKTFKAALADETQAGPLKETIRKKSTDPSQKDTEYGSLTERANDVMQKGKEILGDVSASKDPTGIGGAVASAIGPALGDAIKNAFGSEIKFENVTISNLNVTKLASETNGAKVATAAAVSNQLEIVGEVSLKNLFSAVIKFMGTKPALETTPNGGAPVIAEQTHK